MRLHKFLKEFRYRQFCSSFIGNNLLKLFCTASLPLVSSTTYLTWPSPAIPKLGSENSPIGIRITTNEGSWIASSISIGIILGGIAGCLVIDKLGRKNGLLCSAFPLFTPWIIIAFTNSVALIVAARILAGFGCGIAIMLGPIYNGEIAEKEIRGQLGLFAIFLLGLGNLYVLGVGPFISYKALALSCSIVPLAFIILFYLMPESPYYLVKIGRKEAAMLNLIKLCKCDGDCNVKGLLKEIENTIEDDMKNQSTVWEFISKQQYRRSLLIMTGILFVMEFSGVNVIQAYLQIIIDSSNSSISAENSSVIFGLLQLLAVFFIDKIGRRPLLLVSAFGCAITIAVEGVYFYLQDVVKMDMQHLLWLPTTALAFYLLINNAGLLSLPFVLIGELFATNIKEVATCLFLIYTYALGFIAFKFFEPLSEAWGRYTVFWIFAGVCMFGFIFILYLLPETKGKTFREIQMKLNNKSVMYHDEIK